MARLHCLHRKRRPPCRDPQRFIPKNAFLNAGYAVADRPQLEWHDLLPQELPSALTSVEGLVDVTKSHPHHQSPLFLLPAEIRNHIYHHRFHGDAKIHVYRRYADRVSHAWYQGYSSWSHITACLGGHDAGIPPAHTMALLLYGKLVYVILCCLESTYSDLQWSPQLQRDSRNALIRADFCV